MILDVNVEFYFFFRCVFTCLMYCLCKLLYFALCFVYLQYTSIMYLSWASVNIIIKFMLMRSELLWNVFQMSADLWLINYPGTIYQWNPIVRKLSFPTYIKTEDVCHGQVVHYRLSSNILGQYYVITRFPAGLLDRWKEWYI